MQNLIRILAFISFTLILVACQQSGTSTKKIGIIVPIEHKAMDEIVSGFTETLRQNSSDPLQFKIANAQGDPNLQRAIIQQMKDDHYDLIVPIGSAATQMSNAIAKTQPIVSLAADFSNQERTKQKPCHIAVVHDEISPEQIIAFIHAAYPHITHLTLIHSASDKIYPDVKIAVQAGKKYNIEIKPLMVPTLNELYSIAHALPSHTQGILLLKDVILASGISTLVMTAQQHHIPLLTSDQGTVEQGATLSLGVHERDIGREGGKLAASILSGQSTCSLPIVDMKHLTIFINKDKINNGLSLASIQSVADKQHLRIEITK